MYLSLILIAVIALLIWLYFVCIKTGRIEQKKSYWLLPAGVIVLFVMYYFYCPYFWSVFITILVVSLIVYILMVLKV